MSLAIAYWVIMLLWIVLGLWSHWPMRSPVIIVGDLILFLLLIIVGWKVFGPPING